MQNFYQTWPQKNAPIRDLKPMGSRRLSPMATRKTPKSVLFWAAGTGMALVAAVTLFVRAL